MNTRQENKVSWVEFLRSIQFDQKRAKRGGECASHFASFEQRAPGGQSANAEDQFLVRSAN